MSYFLIADAVFSSSHAISITLRHCIKLITVKTCLDCILILSVFGCKRVSCVNPPSVGSCLCRLQTALQFASSRNGVSLSSSPLFPAIGKYPVNHPPGMDFQEERGRSATYEPRMRRLAQVRQIQRAQLRNKARCERLTVGDCSLKALRCYGTTLVLIRTKYTRT